MIQTEIFDIAAYRGRRSRRSASSSIPSGGAHLRRRRQTRGPSVCLALQPRAAEQGAQGAQASAISEQAVGGALRTTCRIQAIPAERAWCSQGLGHRQTHQGTVAAAGAGRWLLQGSMSDIAARWRHRTAGGTQGGRGRSWISAVGWRVAAPGTDGRCRKAQGTEARRL